MPLHISSAFDSGNIHVVGAERPGDIRLEIRRDAHSNFYQWFHYRVNGARGLDCVMRIVNAGGAAYVGGWEGYLACASYDRERWFRAPTAFDGDMLTISHAPEHDSVWYAYFAPYSMARHHDQIALRQRSERVTHEVLGHTLDGQDLDLLSVGAPGAGKRVCWTIARQHPGETMAEWWMEGFLDRLLDDADPLARALLERAVFHIVPNMNPDGSRCGHLRTNAAGANLNRAWAEPSMAASPEVCLVRRRMEQTGVDFCLDVHGDEALPYVFLVESKSIPAITDRLVDLQDCYAAALLRANPDFQRANAYPRAAPGKANMTMCSNHVAQTFDCLSMTLEMPFKDNADAPDKRHGWSPARSKLLGRAGLDALAAVIDDLR